MNHVGLSVLDINRSVKFYCDILGMEVVGKVSFAGVQYEMVLALQGASGKAVLLRGENIQLELFEFSHPLPKRKDPRYPVSDHGLSHFCIEVVDILGEYERLKEAGVYFHCPPVVFSSGATATYARDPDGNVIEFLELTNSPVLRSCKSN